MNQPAIPQLLPLTSLRFVAAFLIVIHHLKGEIWLPSTAMEPFNFGASVSFFFVLSGFVLHYSYHKKISEMSWVGFVIVRFLRIWPLHIAVLVISWLWLNTGNIEYQLARLNFAEIFSILILMQSWIPNDWVFFGLNGPSWSISTELFFYLSFPALSYLLSRNFQIFALLTVLQISAWLLFATVLTYGSEDEMYVVGLAYINPLARIAEFASGMIAAHLFQKLVLRQRVPKSIRLFTALELTVLAMAVLISVKTHHESYFITEVIGPTFGSVIQQWSSSSSGIIIYPFIIVIFALEKGLISKLISNAFFVWLGTISFAVYLVHVPLILYWKTVVSKHIEAMPVSVFVFVTTLVILSALLHAFVEKPILKFAKTLVYRKANGS